MKTRITSKKLAELSEEFGTEYVKNAEGYIIGRFDKNAVKIQRFAEFLQNKGYAAKIATGGLGIFF